MATIKVLLRKNANKDGTYPLAIRITKDRKSSFIHLGYSLRKEDWIETEQRVKKAHPNSKRLNNFILAKKAEASNAALEIETHKKDVTTQAIRHRIKPQGGATFGTQAELYLKRLKESKNYNCYVADKSRIKIFMKFISNKDITKEKPSGKKDVVERGMKDIAFPDITLGLLENFKVALISKREASERTIMNYLMVVRSVFSQAIKEGIIDGRHYPFGKQKIAIRLPESTKIGKSREDVLKLEKVNLPIAVHDHARNLWLTSYYYAGMRISDVLRLKWSDFINMRLHYTMGKNNKPGSVKILDKALQILKKYEHLKRHPDDFVFPDLKEVNLKDEFEVQRLIAQAVNRYNKILTKFIAPAAEIEGKLTMHLSRHTFASEAGDKVPIKVLQMLYRHSDPKTTLAYQSAFIYKDADDALDAVLGK
ncbi:MAG: site-specific integrase [Flavobacterium sp.]|nr:site-specific integrase [Flavobacterium sp.]